MREFLLGLKNDKKMVSQRLLDDTGTEREMKKPLHTSQSHLFKEAKVIGLTLQELHLS